MNWDEQYSSLIGLIYDSTDTEQGWIPVVQQVSEVLGAPVAHAFLRSNSQGHFLDDALWGKSHQLQMTWHTLAHLDPRLNVSIKNPNKIINDAEFFSADFVRESSFYNEYLIPNQIRHSMSAILPLTDDLLGGFAVMRPASRGGFEKKHQERLAHLLPHIARALSLQRRLRELENDTRHIVAALDGLPTAAVIVSGQLKVICANRQAEALLAATDSLRVRHGILFPERSEAASALREAVAGAVSLADSMVDSALSPPQVVTIPRAAQLPLEVLAVPLRPRYKLRQQTGEHSRVLLLIYDPELRPTLDGAMLERLFDLTSSEAFIAARLAEGHSIGEIATLRCCSPSTVRTHIKRIFLKTQTSRQAELVQLILTSPAISCGI